MKLRYVAFNASYVLPLGKEHTVHLDVIWTFTATNKCVSGHLIGKTDYFTVSTRTVDLISRRVPSFASALMLFVLTLLISQSY